MSNVRIGVDIGGTFTDVVTYDETTHRYATNKVLSTHGSLERGVIEGIEALVPRVDAASFAVHGTTVGINSLIERRGARVLLATTAGVRDTYLIARGDRPRPRMYDSHYRRPQPLVARQEIVEIGGRLDYRGEELEPVNTDDLDRVVDRVRRETFDAVAVCFLFSYAEPRHELEAAEYLEQRLPGVSIVLSHLVAREWREYERLSSTVVAAYIAPVVQSYLRTLEDELDRSELAVPLHVMQSNGGITSATAAARRPLQTLLSGPVGGSAGAAALARMTGRPNLLCVDVGGTSSDVSLIVDGEPEISVEASVEGHDLLMPIVTIHTIGAGGGSIAYAADGGLRVGPRSAGSVPGPACYGLGGTQPTVTDANLALGRLDADSFLGGRMTLDLGAARDAIIQLAESLDMTETELAEGIVAVTNAKMADAIRTVTVERGVEPRDFAILAFGGAGPMHATYLARELGISEVVIPPDPGSFSAWGMLHTTVRHDATRVFYAPADPLPVEELCGVLSELEAEGAEALDGDGIARDRMSFGRGVDMRYVGQEYSVTVPINEGDLDPGNCSLTDRFHDVYRARYGHATPGVPIEFVIVRVAALGAVGEPAGWAPAGRVSGTSGGEFVSRQAVFDGEACETQVLAREQLRTGEAIPGPTIIEEPTTTIVVPPGMSAAVDELGCLVISEGVS